MQVFALEILGALLLAIAAFLSWRWLVNNKSFQNFVDNSKPSLTADEIEERLDRDLALADEMVTAETSSIKKKARAVKRVKTRLGE